MYSLCPQNLDRGSREKDRTVSFQRNEQKKAIEKAACCVVPTIGHSGKGKSMKRLKRSAVARATEE